MLLSWQRPHPNRAMPAADLQACSCVQVISDDNPQGEVTQVVECPPGIVGRVIGSGGETIRALQQASQAHIVVDQNFPEGVDRKVNINGRADAVTRAVKMVTELINGEPGSATAIIQKVNTMVNIRPSFAPPALARCAVSLRPAHRPLPGMTCAPKRAQSLTGVAVHPAAAVRCWCVPHIGLP